MWYTWTATGGVYTFVITERYDGTCDLNITYLKKEDYFWFGNLASAKRFVRNHYKGLDITRFKKTEQ